MVEWNGDKKNSTLMINNKRIGWLTSFNDCDESFGWDFNWDYDAMLFEIEGEYFEVSETEMLWDKFEEVKIQALTYVLDTLVQQCKEQRSMCRSLIKEISSSKLNLELSKVDVSLYDEDGNCKYIEEIMKELRIKVKELE